MSYFITANGVQIYIDRFDAYMVNLKDIAHHLTKICRYGGSLDFDQHYSVAQHSIRLADYAERHGYSEDVQRYLLMHDASEAYMGDVTSSLKQCLPDYINLEDKVQRVILEKYRIFIDYDDLLDCKSMDKDIIINEIEFFKPRELHHFTNSGHSSLLDVGMYNETDLNKTYRMFLYFCKKLEIKDE